eukprot:368378-Lingulodinium_polyedra.AAC.1
MSSAPTRPSNPGALRRLIRREMARNVGTNQHVLRGAPGTRLKRPPIPPGAARRWPVATTAAN